jgi:hypothetical protein
MKNYKVRLQVASLAVGAVLIAAGLLDRRDVLTIAGAVLVAAVLLATSRD